MTAINIATDIPSQIDTLEKLAAWSGLALANMNAALVAVEGPGYTERVSQAGVFYVQADNKYRILVRHSIQMEPEHLAGGSKLWTYAKSLSDTGLPTIFKSN